MVRDFGSPSTCRSPSRPSRASRRHARHVITLITSSRLLSRHVVMGVARYPRMGARPSRLLSRHARHGFNLRPAGDSRFHFVAQPRIQISASRPFRSRRFNSLADGPLGCFSPISHCRTVDTLVFRTVAKTAWLSL